MNEPNCQPNEPMKTIFLSGGKQAIVDDEDFELVNSHKWHCHPLGYATRKVPSKTGIGPRQKNEWMHRVINGTPDGIGTDHINGNRLDNRRSNLRVATSFENSWNRKMSTRNTTGVKGVYFNKEEKRFKASIMVNGRRLFFGGFSNVADAAKKISEARNVFHGEFSHP